VYHPEKTYIKLAKTTLRFVWLPKRCVLTNKILWLTLAYKLEYNWSFNYGRDWPAGEPANVSQWADCGAVVIAKIKGEEF